MTGGGNYKSALTKITDSVASTASDTAASAKAVKSAYDRGSAGITAAGNAQAAANNALSVANSKAPGGFGLGVDAPYDLVSDLNAAVKNGWYSTSPATANISEANEYGFCLVSCCDDNTIYQLHLGANVCIRKISHRQHTYGTWRAICNTATGDARYANQANIADNAQKLGGKTANFNISNDDTNYLLALGTNNDIVARKPQDVIVQRARSIVGIQMAYPNSNVFTVPSGGSYIVICQYKIFTVGIWDIKAGGTRIDAGNPVSTVMFLPVA